MLHRRVLDEVFLSRGHSTAWKTLKPIIEASARSFHRLTPEERELLHDALVVDDVVTEHGDVQVFASTMLKFSRNLTLVFCESKSIPMGHGIYINHIPGPVAVVRTASGHSTLPGGY